MTRRMCVRRFCATAAVVIALACGAVSSADEPEVFLSVTKHEAEKIPLILLPVAGAPPALTAEVQQVLLDDLRRSGFFAVSADASAAASSPPAKATLDRLKSTGAKAVLWALVTVTHDDLTLQGELFDTAVGRQLLAKRYLGKQAYARYVTHRLADDVVAQMTGERGVAATRVTYVSDQTRQKEIWLMDYDGASPRRVTGDHSLALSPRWTPDAKWISYLCYRSGNPDICMIDLTENRRWRLVTLPGLNMSPAWSPDGEWMAFASNVEGGNLELQRISRDGKRRQRMTFSNGDDLSPSWSPTGRQLVFVSDRGGSPQLYIMDADGANTRRLTFQGDYNTSPVWSPRGDWIAYACRRHGLMRLCLIHPDGRDGGIFTPDGDYNDESPTWSPTGRQLIFSSNRTGRYQLYLIQSDGSGLEPLSNGSDNRTSPAWSPK